MPSQILKTKKGPLKTLKLATVALLLISGFGVCRANLGETEAQCIARYGTELNIQNDLGYRQVGDKAASFNMKTAYGGLFIKITFLNGLSCHESFSNADSSQGLSVDQMKSIADSQSAGLKWRKGQTVYRSNSDSTFGTIDWLRTDGATARFWLSGKANSQTQSGQIDLSTKQYAYAQNIYDKENGDN
jgi:hypothetical protein